MKSGPTKSDSLHLDAVMASGFAMAAAMWTAGYFCRLPFVQAPSWILLFFLIAILAVGSFLTGKHAAGGWKAGFFSSLLAATLNLLIMGSLIGGDRPNSVVPSMLAWLPGSMVFSALTGAAAGAAGRSRAGRMLDGGEWLSFFALTAAGATMMLMLIGGMVTSKQAGLAVVDWPNSYGYNMFLYPLSKMTGGIYYEHAHRLFGALVGLTILALTVRLHFAERRGWVRKTSLFILFLVAVQGVLGGLRVTGVFTMSSMPEDTAPNIFLAVAHGALGQIVFGAAVALAAFLSPAWMNGAEARPAPHAATEWGITSVLTALLTVQLVLGASLRHLQAGLMIHVTMAILVVSLAVACGSRAWGMNEPGSPLHRLGKALLALAGIQVTLGFAALVAANLNAEAAEPGAVKSVVRTAHQFSGSLFLAVAAATAAWSRRMLKPPNAAGRPAADAANGKNGPRALAHG